MDYDYLRIHLRRAIDWIYEYNPESIKIALAKPYSDILTDNLRKTTNMAGITYVDRPGRLHFMGVEIQPYPYIDHFLVFDPDNSCQHPELCIKYVFPKL